MVIAVPPWQGCPRRILEFKDVEPINIALRTACLNSIIVIAASNRAYALPYGVLKRYSQLAILRVTRDNQQLSVRYENDSTGACVTRTKI